MTVTSPSAGPAGQTAISAADKRAAARARKSVLDIARRHFGESAKRVVELGGGLTNAVYRVKVSRGEFVVRTNEDPTKIQAYLKEQWAMNVARAAGVPTPQVVEVGNFSDGRAYMVAESVTGIDGQHAPHRLAVLEQMGQAAAVLHTVRTNGFGTVFDWSTNSLSRHDTWSSYLTHGFDVDGRIATLLHHKAIGHRQARWLRHAAKAMARSHRRPSLQHGDLRLKNVILDPEHGRLAGIIDWESCASMPGPEWDLSLALHDLGVDEKEAFLTGYGVTAKQFAGMLDAIRCINVLNYTHAVRSAASRKDRERMAWLRLRLAGELDLFIC